MILGIQGLSIFKGLLCCLLVHRPLVTQNALSGRSIESIFVGIARDYASGVVLLNPAKSC